MESSYLWPVTAVLPYSRAVRTPIFRPSKTSPPEYSIRSFGPAKSDADLTEQIDQTPRTRGQRRVIGLELNRDSFQSFGKRAVRRGWQIGGFVDQAIDVLHHIAQRFPGL